MTKTTDNPEPGTRRSGECYVTIADVARRLRLSQRWVEYRVQDGSIPSYKFGRARRLLLSEVEAALVAGRAA